MLERIREGSQGPWAMIVIGLVVLSFVFAGVGSYLNSSGPTAVATVNGDEIDQSTLERAYQNQRARMESEYGESVSAMFADENYLKDFRRNVLERLINDKLIEQEALELGLSQSNEASSFKVYPNPVRNKLYLDQLHNMSMKAILKDFSGKSREIEIVNGSIDCTEYSAGMYLIEFKHKGQTRQLTFIKH
mgnify:CR=1 FL=1